MSKKTKNTTSISKKKFTPKLFLILYIPILIFSFFHVYNNIFDHKIDLGGDNVYYYILGNSIATGQGYTNIETKQKIANTHFPPGYPLIIAGVSKIFSNRIDFIKKVNGFFFFLSIGLMFFVIYDLTGNFHIPFITSLFLLQNFFLLRSSTIMMSEIPFLFFSTLCLWMVIKIDFTKPLKKNWLFFILILIVVFTYHIRSFGLALLVGIVIFLAFEKRWKYVYTLVGGFVLLALPWYIRTKRLGGSSYIHQLFQKNPYRPELGKMGFADWFTRFWHNLERYTTREIPSGNFNFLIVTNHKQPITNSEWIIGVLIIAVMIYGLFRLKKYSMLLLFYILASFGILLLWPDVWFGTRFMLPLVPLLTFLFINGFIGLINLLGFKVLKIKSQVAIYLVLVALSVASINSYGKHSVELLEKQARGNFQKSYQNYFKMAEWIKKNAPANSVTCCRKNALFYLYSGKYVTGFANTNDEVKQINYLKKRGVDYVVLDHLGYSSTGRYLYPAIKKFPNKFKVIKHIKDPDTYLFKFKPELGYWGQWKNNKRNGFGTFRWENGMRFEGMWKDNVRNGKGILYNPNGQRREGNWENDKLNGTVVVKSKDGKALKWIIYKNNKPIKVYNKKISN